MTKKLLMLGLVIGVAAVLAAPVVMGHGNKAGSSSAKIGGGEVKVECC